MSEMAEMEINRLKREIEEGERSVGILQRMGGVTEGCVLWLMRCELVRQRERLAKLTSQETDK